MVDADQNDFGINFEEVEKICETNDVKGIIIVHPLGVPVNKNKASDRSVKEAKAGENKSGPSPALLLQILGYCATPRTSYCYAKECGARLTAQDFVLPRQGVGH